MSDLVPAESIQQLVGAPRHERLHLGRAVSAEETVYVLHSQACLDSGIDLRECQFSTALDQGIDPERWEHHEDRPVILVIRDGELDPWDYTPDPSGDPTHCHECPSEGFEWSDTVWVADAPAMVCTIHGMLAPGYVYEAAL